MMRASSELDPRLFPGYTPETRTFDGVWLRRAILARRWTLFDFAKVCGLSNQGLWRVLNGERVRDSTVIKVYNALGTRQPPRPPR